MNISIHGDLKVFQSYLMWLTYGLMQHENNSKYHKDGKVLLVNLENEYFASKVWKTFVYCVNCLS